MRKKQAATIAIVLSLCFLLLIVPVASATGTQETETLRFRDGGFKIMHIPDIQDGRNVSSYTIKLITLALEAEQPDLVVLGGDNIYGDVPSVRWSTSGVQQSIAQFLQPIVERDIPFCLVFGNHDPECSTPLESQIAYYQTFAGCLALAGEDMSGTGNYNLLLMDETGETPLANLWFFDSGNHATSEYGKGYDWVREDQIAWYAQTQQALAAENGGVQLPAFVFQHIPVVEIYDLLTEVPKGTAGAVQGSGRWSDGYYLLNEALVSDGSMGEGPCPPDYNGGQFASWVEQGDVVAAFFGHDHVNDFTGTLEGIDLVYTAGTGFHSYGNGYAHGVRIIEIPEQNPSAYTTRMVYFSDLTDEKIPAMLQFNGSLFYLQVGAAATLGVLVLTLLFFVIRAARRHRHKLVQAKPNGPKRR